MEVPHEHKLANLMCLRMRPLANLHVVIVGVGIAVIVLQEESLKALCIYQILIRILH